jgi:hypothetical protein
MAAMWMGCASLLIVAIGALFATHSHPRYGREQKIRRASHTLVLKVIGQASK